ncbi:hypothetical protein HPB47_015702, partial [Ixodes persulcatus]
EDVRDTSKEHDNSCTLSEVSDSFPSLSDDALFAKPRDFGFQAGLVVASTRSPYERQLQQLLNNGSVPTTPSVPTDEFSATEEEEPQVIPEDSSDDEDGSTPLKKEPATFFPLSAQSVRFNLSNSNSLGVNEAARPSRRSFTYSTPSSSLPQAASPVHMTLRSRAGTRGEDMAGQSAATTPAVGKQRRMYIAVKKISSAPNCVVRKGGMKRHLQDLLPPKEKKPKVSGEPKVNHKRSEHESHWDEMEADGAQRKEADDRGPGEADDELQGGAENEGQSDANEDEAFAPDDCSTLDDASSCDRTRYAAFVDNCRAGDEIGAPLHRE